VELDAEAQLNRIGLQIEESDFDRDDEPDVIGFVKVEWLTLDHSKYTATIFVRPGTNPSERATFATWVRDVIARWVEHGPEVDAWQRRESDAGWQLWARRTCLPAVD
jgi:hypothetical protein